MITEDQLEQLAIQWFQDTGWAYANGADYSRRAAALTPALSQGERGMGEPATAEGAEFRAVVLKARLAAVVQRLWEGGGFHA